VVRAAVQQAVQRGQVVVELAHQDKAILAAVQLVTMQVVEVVQAQQVLV
jgi:hypothetical protein